MTKQSFPWRVLVFSDRALWVNGGWTDASCESVHFYMSCLFCSWLRWRDMGSGLDPRYQGSVFCSVGLFLFCFFFRFFVFKFLVELCVWVKLKRMNKDRYKLAFPCLSTWFVLQNTMLECWPPVDCQLTFEWTKTTIIIKWIIAVS